MRDLVCIVSIPDNFCDRLSKHTDKRVRELFLVGHIHVQRTSHVLLREKVVHHCGWQPQSVVRIHPVLLEGMRGSRVWWSHCRRRCASNGLPWGSRSGGNIWLSRVRGRNRRGCGWYRRKICRVLQICRLQQRVGVVVGIGSMGHLMALCVVGKTLNGEREHGVVHGHGIEVWKLFRPGRFEGHHLGSSVEREESEIGVGFKGRHLLG